MFPQIYKGKPFKPDIARDNAVIERLNRLDGVSEHFQRSKNASFSINATPAENWSGTRLAGTAVGFNIREKSEYSAVIEPYANHQFWGVLLEDCDGENAASVIVSGIAEVAVSGTATGMFATPNADGTFSLSDSGSIPVLQHDVEANTALVVIGAGGGGGMGYEYDGQFKVTFSPGMLSVSDGYTDVPIKDGLKIKPWSVSIPNDVSIVPPSRIYISFKKLDDRFYEPIYFTDPDKEQGDIEILRTLIVSIDEWSFNPKEGYWKPKKILQNPMIYNGLFLGGKFIL